MLIWGLFRNDMNHLFAVSLRSGRDHFKTCLPHFQQVAVPGLAGFNSLVDRNDNRVGPRFPAMSKPFDKKMQALVGSAADRLGFGHKMRYKGVYVCVSGPSYETRHEVEFVHTLGGTAVGMSNVQEVVVAVHADMKVMGLTCVTNKAMGPSDEQLPPDARGSARNCDG